MNGRNYFSFTKRERTGIIALVVLLLIVAIVPKLFYRRAPVAEKIPSKELEKLTSENKYNRDYHFKNRDSAKTDHYKFERRNYQRYKPWEKYNLREKYIPGEKYKEQYYHYKYKQDYAAFHKPGIKISVIEVNSADTTAFIALPGIGSKLASRIVAFREKLGGFYDVQQISEVYGLQDSVFQMIRPRLTCNSGHLRKIDINIADKDALKIHPYIRWNIANALVAYRSQHGAFGSPEDLARINNINNDAIRKITPYLSFK